MSALVTVMTSAVDNLLSGSHGTWLQAQEEDDSRSKTGTSLLSFEVYHMFITEVDEWTWISFFLSPSTRPNSIDLYLVMPELFFDGE